MHTESDHTVQADMCVCVCGGDCAAAHIHERTCAMTRPRQGMPCSCLFHLMRQSQALIDSIYLALTLICQDAARQTAPGPMESVSQLQNVFQFLLRRNKGVQTCIHSSSKRSPILSRLHGSFTRLSVRSAQAFRSTAVSRLDLEKWFTVFSFWVFFLTTNLLVITNFMHIFQWGVWRLCLQKI